MKTIVLKRFFEFWICYLYVKKIKSTPFWKKKKKNERGKEDEKGKIQQKHVHSMGERGNLDR